MYNVHSHICRGVSGGVREMRELLYMTLSERESVTSSGVTTNTLISWPRRGLLEDIQGS